MILTEMNVFRPDRIFIYDKIKNNELVQHIIAQFPNSKVDYISSQCPNVIRTAEPRLCNIRAGNKNAAVIDIAKRILVIGTANRNQLVENFVNKLDCLCPQFYCITPLNNGCYYSCMYCFLQITYRAMFPYIKINVNLEDLKKAILNIAKRNKNEKPLSFNCGEKLDSLSFDNIIGITKVLVPFFAETPELSNSTLLLLTKSDYVDNLVDMAKVNPATTKNTVVSWSLNSDEFARKYELKAPSPQGRLTAAQRCQNAGYRIRLRIDPLLFLPNWESGYEKLVRDIFETYQLRPEIITLGSLRFEAGLRSLAKARFNNPDLFDYDFVVEGHDKRRYKFEDRIKLYQHLIVNIEKWSKKTGIALPHIGLCKEKEKVWVELGLDLKECHCNCVESWSLREAKYRGK